MKPPSARWLQPLAGKADYLGLRGRLFAVAHSPNLTNVVGKPVMNKMERFTQRARDVMSLAQEEAVRLQHGTLDTQHLLFGMLVDQGGVAGRTLREMGIQATNVREKIEQMAPTNTYHSGKPPELSEGTKRVLELAVDEARRMGHYYIGTEHLLLGLVRLTEGGAIEILKRNGISPEELRRQVRQVLQESSLRPEPSETESHLFDSPETKGRFTLRARRALSYTQEEAERFQHDYIGTEHLLLGLFREQRGIAGIVFRQLELDQRRLEELVVPMTRATKRTSAAQPELSPGVKRVLELAVDEAERMAHHYIGTEHLLLGLIRLTEGAAIDILRSLGVSTKEIRRQTLRVLQASPLSAKPPDEGAPAPRPVPNATTLGDYMLRVAVRDTTTNEEKVTFHAPLDRVQVDLANAIRRVLQGKEVEPMEWHSGDNLIEVTVKKAED